MAMCRALIMLIVGACLSRFSFSLPVPNTKVNASNSLPNLLAAVLSARNGHDGIESLHNQKITQNSRESFEDFRISHRNENQKNFPTKSTELISSKPVYFDQRTFATVNDIPKGKNQQQSNPNDLPLFLVLRNYSHSTNNNFLSKKQKYTNIQDNSDHRTNKSDISLFLPVIVDKDDNKEAEFRRLSIPSQFLPGFEHLSNLQPMELVDDLHGYVFDINKENSQHLISFLKQSTLESLESRDRSSSSEEEYLQGRNNANSRESYSEEDYGNEYDAGGEISSEEVKNMMQLITPRKKQGAFATGGSLFIGSPAIRSTIVPKNPQHFLTASSQKINKEQTVSKVPLRTKKLQPTISSKETSYEDKLGSKKHFQLPTSIYNTKTQEPNYDPISSVRSLSQTLSSEFVRWVPKINTFPNSPDSIKSTSGVGSESIRLIPSILYTDERVNYGISGVLGLGQPVSVGLLQ